ncbi:phospho-2-dehydro-3-deoxyheptonate aldolase [Clostridium beijerinckii]|nr:phospho-2-dehydro-3-deoxyheptonate aldolase [Clostridium beijerinckii]
MSFVNVRKIPSPEEIKEITPLADNLKRIKAERDEEIKKIFSGNSDKFVVIIGPCSADDENSVCDYVNRLAKVNEKVKDKLLLFLEFIQISLELLVKDIKECFINQILKNHLIS